jgi:HD-like signal output (HDOD) protein
MTTPTTPEALAQEVSRLFALPELVVRVLAVMNSPTGTARELVEVIELDASLAATVLRLANSALYGHVGKVETLGHAITLIGHQALRDLVLATSVVKTFRDIPAEFVDMDTFWDNSITCGVLAKLLAQRVRLPESEVLFLGGLLHGVGRLVFYARRPAEYREALQKAQAGEADLTAAERQVFGFTYADLGAALLAAWGLPEKLRVAVGYHLAPAKAPGFAKEVAVVHLASQLANSLAPCLKIRQAPAGYVPDESAAASMLALGLIPADLDEARAYAFSACVEVIEIMRPGAATIF